MGDRPAPRDRKGQEEGVQTRIVESLSDVLAGGQDGPCLIPRDGCQSIGDGLPLLLAHPRSQDDEVTDTCHKPLLETVEVVVPFRKNERRPAVVHGLDDVIADATAATLVVNQLLV